MNLEQSIWQFNQALAFYHEGESKEAIYILEKLSSEIDLKDVQCEDFYAHIQLVLIFIYGMRSDTRNASVIFRKFPKGNYPKYIFSQWILLVLYLNDQDNLEFFNLIEQFKAEDVQYLGNVYYIFDLYINIKNKSNREKLLTLHLGVYKILNLIVINQNADNLIAHYTNPTVAYLMLDHKAPKPVSKFRLNPIDFMNDPTEGALIHPLFGLKAKEKQNFQIEKHKSFIGCFTLHHDSLNQFRLYGKENQREASGVSLVLNRSQLFEKESNFIFLAHNVPDSHKESVDLDNSENSQNQQQSSDLKLPLYRCIYFDPDSGLAHVAQREEWTFCREKGSCQDNGWDGYKNEIDSVNKSVRELITDIQKLIQEINSAENSDEAELIDEILLPLRYLIKHYAFKEEQECRTIYITQWNDEKIQLDPNLKRVYVDYQSVLPAIEKIFLSVGALHHESALQYLGQTADQTFIVKRSHNPFRT